jgi:hypothetical protein
MPQTHYRRINKRFARKMFQDGNPFYIVSHKMRPGGPFAMGMAVYPSKHKEESRTFDQLVQDWNYYNASWETGYYPAFYVVYATV